MSINRDLRNRVANFSRIIFYVLFQKKIQVESVATAARGARHLSVGVRLTDPTKIGDALKLSEAVALASGSVNVVAQRQAGIVVYQFQLSQGLWEYYTRADLPSSSAVGLAEKRRPVEFGFAEPHALVAGVTGSGKTEAIRSILASLLASYTPEDLSLVLCDPHSDYQPDLYNVLHLAIPIATTNDDIDQAILYVNQELVRRRTMNIRNAKRLVLAIDEADEVLFEQPQRLAALKTITGEGRKYNVNVVIGSREPSQANLPGVFRSLANRYVGLVVNAAASAMLTGHAGLDAHKLTGQGDFLHVTGGSTSTRFQVATVTPQDLEQLERGEVRQSIPVTPDLVELPVSLPVLPVDNSPGRPALQIEPDTAAWYYFQGPDNISRSLAAEYGISRGSHELHQNFIRQFGKVYWQLSRQRRDLLGGR